MAAPSLSLLNLNDDIIAFILTFLEAADLARATSSCSTLRTYANDGRLQRDVSFAGFNARRHARIPWAAVVNHEAIVNLTLRAPADVPYTVSEAFYEPHFMRLRSLRLVRVKIDTPAIMAISRNMPNLQVLHLVECTVRTRPRNMTVMDMTRKPSPLTFLKDLIIIPAADSDQRDMLSVMNLMCGGLPRDASCDVTLGTYAYDLFAMHHFPPVAVLRVGFGFQHTNPPRYPAALIKLRTIGPYHGERRFLRAGETTVCTQTPKACLQCGKVDCEHYVPQRVCTVCIASRVAQALIPEYTDCVEIPICTSGRNKFFS